MEYQAHAFHKGFPKGRASGTLLVSGHEVVFTAADQRVHFPLQDAVFELGGASDRLVFIRHPHYPDWTLYTSDRSILTNPSLHLDKNIQRQLQKARNVRRFNWSVLVLVLALAIGAPTLLLTNMDWVSGRIAEQIPVEWETKLGKTAFAQIRMEQDFLETDAAKEALAQLTDPLLKAIEDSRYEYHVYISADSELNAFALPGGYIVVNAGLIMAADSAEELLGVMAHEIAHVTEQHGLRSLIGAAGNYAVISAVLGDVSGVLATLSSAAPLLLNQSYSRGFETEADLLGMELLQRARINPRGMVRFFEKLIEAEKERLDQIEDEDTRELVKESMGFLSSHPATPKRIETLEQRLGQDTADYRDLDAEFQRLKAEVTRYVTQRKSQQDNSRSELNRQTEQQSQTEQQQEEPE